MDKCTILKLAIESRRLYLQSFYIYLIGLGIAIIGVFTMYTHIAIFSIILISTGSLINLIALIDHLFVLREISNISDYNPYKPAMYGIIIQVVLVSIAILLLIPYQHTYQHFIKGLPLSHLIVYIILSGITLISWLIFFQQMFKQLGNFINRSTDHLFTLGTVEIIIHSISSMLLAIQAYTIAVVLYGILGVIVYIQLKEFLWLYQQQYKTQCNKGESI